LIFKKNISIIYIKLIYFALVIGNFIMYLFALIHEFEKSYPRT